MANPTGKGGTRFKKGQSGNPNGPKKQDPEIRAFKETTYKDFINKLQEFGSIPSKKMKIILDDEKTTMFDAIFGRILYDASQGKSDARQVLLDRLWGKVKDHVEYSGGVDVNRELIQKLPTSELMEMIKTYFGNKTENGSKNENKKY